MAAMGKTYERIDGRIRTFIEEQHIFFTATAPLDGEGTVNLSPKGVSGSFAVIDELTVAYLDFAGSNAETVAHLRENGRITLMWCASRGRRTSCGCTGAVSRSSVTIRGSVRCSPTSPMWTPACTGCAPSSW
ncbi:pyridoxamine 5'-phosphate oxidase family protein [Streptomyces sp. NPDC048473]|uniref:pyridoxamine 5'-phosphate oxidase family protein n=1 Tax=unclassified Streptomyces TaxID=2593676 RepID=UPI00371BCE68